MTQQEENKITLLLKKEFKDYLKEVWIGRTLKVNTEKSVVLLDNELIDKLWNIVVNRFGSVYSRGYQAGKDRGFYEAGIKFKKQTNNR